jgi:hypothetical protein
MGNFKNDENENPAIYANLGISGGPDNMNPGDEEASDTILYTDNQVARKATEAVSVDDDIVGGIDPTDELQVGNDELDRLNDSDVDQDANDLRAERENDDKDRYLAY